MSARAGTWSRCTKEAVDKGSEPFSPACQLPIRAAGGAGVREGVVGQETAAFGHALGGAVDQAVAELHDVRGAAEGLLAGGAEEPGPHAGRPPALPRAA